MSKIIIYHDLKDIIEKTYYHSSKAHNDYGFGFIVLKHYQQAKGYSFYKINKYLPIEEVLNLYSTLHEADITKFFDITNTYFDNKEISNLKIVRQASGLSQSKLAKLAGVKLRSIQMYEQKRNDINKAQGETLYKLAKVLGCNIEDLLDN